jgi:hypothetical protein
MSLIDVESLSDQELRTLEEHARNAEGAANQGKNAAAYCQRPSFCSKTLHE